MAKSASGKWVSKVGATGGGKAYKKTRPGNYYGVLAIIVILGLLATVLARYDYQHPAKAATGVAPRVGTTWYAALSIQDCGKNLPFLNADPTYKGGFIVEKSNVIRISPVSAADSGNNATVSQFAAEFPGLLASSTELAIPNATGAAAANTTYKNGQTCPAKSKYAGQKGQVSYAYWKYGQTKPTITTNPASIKFAEYMSVTMAFDPAGVKPTIPEAATLDAMQAAGSAPATTTTLPVTTTTAKKSASTTTTTKSKAATTTTAPKG